MNEEGKLNLGICDDEELVCRELLDVMREVLKEEKIIGEVEYFSSGRDLLKEIRRFDLVFLDMDMPDMDGMEVGREIELKNPQCKIVIASSREDRFKETYKIRPLRFISKPFDKREVRDAVNACIETLIGYSEIEVFLDRKSYWFRQRDIQYIAAFRGYVEITVDGCVYRKDISLKQLEEKLEEKMFYKVHKSFIVNLLWVKEIREDEVVMMNARIPLSRRQKRGFEDAYMTFDIKYR